MQLISKGNKNLFMLCISYIPPSSNIAIGNLTALTIVHSIIVHKMGKKYAKKCDVSAQSCWSLMLLLLFLCCFFHHAFLVN